ncbi:hypothetical protein E2C01_091094 [Portunus trituberculatus]|uniref:Uncharacterized protein n=1 Tax=Portunus trituberculatus TaxID=210409 RepID=A0A5B7JMM4_PORTR|nr:hypothetical protein [Portunus trituberculatus]
MNQARAHPRLTWARVVHLRPRDEQVSQPHPRRIISNCWGRTATS